MTLRSALWLPISDALAAPALVALRRRGGAAGRHRPRALRREGPA
ncbi:hypothetical protein ACVGOW_09180 [Pseudonocardia saturnea]